MNERVLIIENQYLQFEQLSNVLPSIKERALNVIPDGKDTFRKLISAVKVWVYKDYPDVYREKCKSIILDFVLGADRSNPVDLIILDYKLGGGMDSLSGIDVANMIWSQNPRIPILFLSRVDYSSKKRFLQSENLKGHFKNAWLMKGFLGEETLAKDFIQYTVYNKIVHLLDGENAKTRSVNDSYIEKIKEIVKLPRNPFQAEWESLLKYISDPSNPPLDQEIRNELDELQPTRAVMGDALRKFVESIIK